MPKIIRLISEDLDKETDSMIKKIQDSFGIEITRKNASKIIAWKSRQYTLPITAKKLKEILTGGNNEKFIQK